MRSRQTRSVRFLVFSVFVVCVSALLVSFMAKTAVPCISSLSVPVSFPGAVFG